MYRGFSFIDIAEDAFDSANEVRARNPRIHRNAYWSTVTAEIDRQYNRIQSQGETLLAKEEWEVTSRFSSQRMLDDIYRIGDLALQAGVDLEHPQIVALQQAAKNLAEAIRNKSDVFGKMKLAYFAANALVTRIPAARSTKVDADNLLAKIVTVLRTKATDVSDLHQIYHTQKVRAYSSDDFLISLISEYNTIVTNPAATDTDKKRLAELKGYLLASNLWNGVDTKNDPVYQAVTAGTAVSVSARLPERVLQNQRAEYFIRLVQQYNELVHERDRTGKVSVLLKQCLLKIQDILKNSNANTELEDLTNGKIHINKTFLNSPDCKPIDGDFEQIIRANAGDLQDVHPSVYVLDFNTSKLAAFRRFPPAEKVLDEMAVAMETELTTLFDNAQLASPNAGSVKMQQAFRTQFEAQLTQEHEVLKSRLAELNPNAANFDEQLYLAVADEHMSRCVQQARAAIEKNNQKTYETQRKSSLTQAKEIFNGRSVAVQTVTKTMPASTMDDDAKLLRAASANKTISENSSADLDLRTVNYLLFNPASLDEKLVEEIYHSLHMAPGILRRVKPKENFEKILEADQEQARNLRKHHIRLAILKEIRTGGLSKFELNYQQITEEALSITRDPQTERILKAELAAGARTVPAATHRAEIDRLVKERAEQSRRLLFWGETDRELADNEVGVVRTPKASRAPEDNIPSIVAPKFVPEESKVEEATILAPYVFDPEFINSKHPVDRQERLLRIKEDARKDALRGKYEHLRGLEAHQESFNSKVTLFKPNIEGALQAVDPKQKEQDVHSVMQGAFETALDSVKHNPPDFDQLQAFTVSVYKNIITEFEKNLQEINRTAKNEDDLKEKITKLRKDLQEQLWQLRQVLDTGTEDFPGVSQIIGKDPSYYSACHDMLEGIKAKLDKVEKKITSAVDDVSAAVLSSPVIPAPVDFTKMQETTTDLDKFVEEAFATGEKLFSQSAEQQNEKLKNAFAAARTANQATINHTILNISPEQQNNALQEKYLELTEAAYETVKRNEAKHWDDLAAAREAAAVQKLAESKKELQEHFIKNLIVPLNPGLFPKTASTETPKLEPGKEYKLSQSGKLTMRVNEYGATSFNVNLSKWANKHLPGGAEVLLPLWWPGKKGVEAIDWARGRLAYEEIAKEIGAVAAFIKTPVTVNCPGNRNMEAILTAALESQGVVVLGKPLFSFKKEPSKVATVARALGQAAVGLAVGDASVVEGVDTADKESKALKMLKGGAQILLGGITRDPSQVAAGMKTISTPSKDEYTAAIKKNLERQKERDTEHPTPSRIPRARG